MADSKRFFCITFFSSVHFICLYKSWYKVTYNYNTHLAGSPGSYLACLKDCLKKRSKKLECKLSKAEEKN